MADVLAEHMLCTLLSAVVVVRRRLISLINCHQLYYTTQLHLVPPLPPCSASVNVQEAYHDRRLMPDALLYTTKPPGLYKRRTRRRIPLYTHHSLRLSDKVARDLTIYTSSIAMLVCSMVCSTHCRLHLQWSSFCLPSGFRRWSCHFCNVYLS